MLSSFLRLFREEDGPTAVEYAVLLAMILLALIAAVQLTGGKTYESFEDSRSQIEAATA